MKGHDNTIERAFLHNLGDCSSPERTDRIFSILGYRVYNNLPSVDFDIRDNVNQIGIIDKWIAGKGIPVDLEWMDFVDKKIPETTRSAVKAINDKWPLVAQANPDGSMVLNWNTINRNLRGYGFQPGDEVSTKTLDPWKNTDTFPGDFRSLLKFRDAISSIKKGYLQSCDGRIYIKSLYPYASSTGRFQPKTREGFVFNLDKAFRTVLNPPAGKMLVDIDYHAQEMAIQAVLSGDKAFREAYVNGDIYSNLGRIIGLQDRNISKHIVIPWSYGAGEYTMDKMGVPGAASKLNERFPVLASYKKRLSNNNGYGVVPDGFTIDLKTLKPSARINWPFQAFGAYILREVVKKFYAAKIPIIATVHDAVVLEVDENDWDTIDKALEIMSQVPKELLHDDILTCTRDQVAVWKHHTLDDLCHLGREEFVAKVGDLVAWDDVVKFRKLFCP